MMKEVDKRRELTREYLMENRADERRRNDRESYPYLLDGGIAISFLLRGEPYKAPHSPLLFELIHFILWHT